MSLFGCGVEPTDATQDFTNAQELGSIEGTLASTCSLDTVGTTETCMNPADWKTQVGAMCAAAGGTLGVIGYANDCGEGRWRQAKFQCCGAEAPTTPEATCSTAVIGNADICMGTAAWNNALQNKCVSEGGNLTNVSFGAACTGGHSFATYTCCNDPASTVINSPTDTEIEQVDPAPVCEMQLLGTGNTCETADYWQNEAAATCSNIGHGTDNVVMGANCGDGTYSFASATCCPASVDQITTPINQEAVAPQKAEAPEGCKIAVITNVCMDGRDFKAQAEKSCHSAGGRMIGLALSQQCKPGLWSHAEYTCCESKPNASATAAPVATEETANDASEAATETQKHNAPHITLPEPSLVCDGHKFGSSNTCQSADKWRQDVTEFCGKSGAAAHNLTLRVECKGGHRAAQVTCCQPAERCAAAAVTTNQCLPEKEAIGQAMKACEQAGGRLTRFQPRLKCGKGGIEQYVFQCCGN